MKQYLIFLTVVFALSLFAACGSDDDHMHNQMQGNMNDHNQDSGSMGMNEDNMHMNSDKAWVRSEPIDVKSLDTDNDGYVFQDHMDWNVIADQEGSCPQCGMTLKKVTIQEAEKNLKDNGFDVAQEE
jgi:hypothetical protein